ncbi:hypothetical protein [Aestuariivivens sp. NBU2969]|uniref:hypothetical protein n=1 Tax=Aestuariivivens sp. NBU2969 TaxID=2873267 RepID=UPI001CBEF0FA|nr:hypothetical protein [Aestuariivivens sp. NBU2969]
MKNLIFAITLILSINVCAQNEIENTNVFVRVYDFQGKKIGKGKILSISETSLQLYRKGESVKVMVNGIGSIKTKHSAGNNVLVGAATGATTMAILGAATADPDAWIFAYTAGEGAAVGALLGGTAGAVSGGISILFKNSKSYDINGDMEKWKAFKEMIIK